LQSAHFWGVVQGVYPMSSLTLPAQEWPLG